MPITAAADDNFFYFLIFFSEKTSLDISCESSAWLMIHMKCQDFFFLKNKKKIECRLLQILLGALRVNSTDIFLISPQKHMLLVLIRSAPVRCF